MSFKTKMMTNRYFRKVFLWCLILGTLLSAASNPVAASETPADSAVVVLTNANFDAEVAKHNVTLVEFYAPWCGHCKRLAPELDEAARKLAPLGLTIHKVDCDQHEEACRKFDIAGYPTLKLFEHGEVKADAEPRTADAIYALLVRLSKPAVEDVDSQDKLKAIEEREGLVLGVFPKAEGDVYANFEKLASTYRLKLSFGRILLDQFQPAGLKLAGDNKPTFLSYHPENEELGLDTFEGDATDLLALKRFCFRQLVPLLATVSYDNHAKFVDADLPMAYIFTSSEEERVKLRPTFLALAKKYRPQVSFMFIDGVEHAGHAQAMGLKNDTFPSFVIHDLTKSRKYPMPYEPAFSLDTVTKHTEAFLADALKPFYLSETLPATQDGPVLRLSHDTFDAVVQDATRDILVNYYVPHYPSCAQFAPLLDQLGELFLPHEKLMRVASLRVDENDIPESAGLELQYVPTLVLYPAVKGGESNKTAIKYEGRLVVPDLKAFILEHVTNKIELKEEAAPSNAAPADADAEEKHIEL